MGKVPEDPIVYFTEWFEEAIEHRDIKEANAVNLATASRDGVPSNRMVLLKNFNSEGFTFYTNLESRKGRQLKENAFAAMCFYWEPLGRQIRIEGYVMPVSDEEADIYFASRPLKSRIGAWASKQSQLLESRAILLKEVAKQTARFMTQEVTRPSFWSGYRLVPCHIEFWQKEEYRVHDRICYTQDQKGQWSHSLLYP